jgi:hypothetical protein
MSRNFEVPPLAQLSLFLKKSKKTISYKKNPTKKDRVQYGYIPYP